MTNDAAVAWLVTNGGESCEPWLVWELSEVKALPSSCIADPLYSATTVAELRAEVERKSILIEQFMDKWAEEVRRADAAERRVAELERVCAEAYQVVGVLLSDTDQFDTDHGEKILDNLSEARIVHEDVLPWESKEARHG